MRPISARAGCGLVAALIIIAGVALPAAAFDPASFSHTPPELHAGNKDAAFVSVSVPADGVSRARVLMARLGGLRIVPMELRDGRATALLPLDDLAMARYQFQLQDPAGAIFESEFYTIRRAGAARHEDAIRALEQRRTEERARTGRLKDALEIARQTDPAQLEKRRNQELAQALVTLGRKERELEQLKRGKP